MPPLELSTSTMLAVLLGTVRASAWLIVCPPFNSRLLPAPVKALLALALALPMAPKLAGAVPKAELGALTVSAIEQVVVGAALGFVTAIFFAAVQAAGDLLDVVRRSRGGAERARLDEIRATGGLKGREPCSTNCFQGPAMAAGYGCRFWSSGSSAPSESHCC